MNRYFEFLIAFVAFATTTTGLVAQLPQNYSSTIFEGGQEGPSGTSNYRIPSMVVTPDGSLLAFIEARRNASDPGHAGFPIDMAVKRSIDGGQTWIDYTVLHANSNFDYSDPRPVVDLVSGQVHVLYTQWPDGNGQSGVPVANPASNLSSVIFLQTTADNGQTWSGPININTQVKDPSWRVLNSGPGMGIQLKWQDSPAFNGRVFIPAHHATGNGQPLRPIGFFSDNAGINWFSGTSTTGITANESDVVELTNGDLLLDARVNSGRSGQRNRQQWTSGDSGETWTQRVEGTDYTSIPVTTVDTGIVRATATRSGDYRDRILMSAPLGSNLGTGNSRNNMGIWTSYDEGRTFINPVLLDLGHAGYSSLVTLHDGSFGLIYEETGNTHIRYINFDLSHIENQTHQAETSHYDGFGNSVARNNSGMGWSGSWNGDATFTAINRIEFDGSSISFPGFPFQQDDGRVDLDFGNDGEIVRKFSKPIDLDSNSTTYVSMLVSQALDSSVDDTSQEFLDIEFLTGSGVSDAAFGVGSQEAFFITRLGNTISAPDNSMLRSENYFLVAKIVSQDDSAGNFDQMFLSVMASGDSIPNSDSDLEWTLVGTTTENLDSVLESLSIEGGNNAYWSVDEIRVGSTWESVASNVATVFADSVNVTHGNYAAGGLVELADSDDADFSIRRKTSDVQSRTEFEVKSFSPVANPGSMAITLEGAVIARSTVNQTIELFDYVANGWEEVDTRAAMQIVDSISIVDVTGDLSRFVEPTTFCVLARVRYQSSNPRQQFSSFTDQFTWTIGL